MLPEELKNSRILIVDDQPANVLLLERLVAREGCRQVRGLTDSSASAAAAAEFRPDLLLLDLQMPPPDGFAILEQLRQTTPADARFPVLVLTANTTTEAKLRALSLGADDFLTKPFDVVEVVVRLRNLLEKRLMQTELRDRAAGLAAANQELEAFSYAVSHDLRAPLRIVDGFGRILLEEHGPRLDEQGRRHVERMVAAVDRMARLIDDLMILSRVTQAELTRVEVDLSALTAAIAEELLRSHAGRAVDVRLQPGLKVRGDPGLLRAALTNLLDNAFKYTRRTAAARVEFGAELGQETVYHVRDNGAGFDTAYADRLFAPFARLHSESEFEGTGIGLATVRRIIRRHGGRIWAEAALGSGATFRFTLPQSAGAGPAEVRGEP
jgi:signal transduction histidine kinase